MVGEVAECHAEPLPAAVFLVLPLGERGFGDAHGRFEEEAAPTGPVFC
jgi:hypothetical protein